ncbi:MAG: hypothetical protein ABIT20_17600 [Gemmatimonadaceae bacterium]
MLRPSCRTSSAIAAALLMVAGCTEPTTGPSVIEPVLGTARWSDGSS